MTSVVTKSPSESRPRLPPRPISMFARVEGEQICLPPRPKDLDNFPSELTFDGGLAIIGYASAHLPPPLEVCATKPLKYATIQQSFLRAIETARLFREFEALKQDSDNLEEARLLSYQLCASHFRNGAITAGLRWLDFGLDLNADDDFYDVALCESSLASEPATRAAWLMVAAAIREENGDFPHFDWDAVAAILCGKELLWMVLSSDCGVNGKARTLRVEQQRKYVKICFFGLRLFQSTVQQNFLNLTPTLPPIMMASKTLYAAISMSSQLVPELVGKRQTMPPVDWVLSDAAENPARERWIRSLFHVQTVDELIPWLAGFHRFFPEVEHPWLNRPQSAGLTWAP